MSAFFVTATGTEVGKTFVTRGLVGMLRRHGASVSALKPVVSGFRTDAAAESDPGRLLQALGEEVSEASIARISPWRFEAPLSPDMAAAREGRKIDYEALLAFCRGRLAAADGTLFIEGVGGAMVPLDDRHTVRDWMVDLGLPLVVVTGSYLGAISHTLTILEAMARTPLSVAALVVNESGDGAVPMAETLTTLRRFVGPSPVGPLRRVSDENAATPDLMVLWRTISAAD
jgi:dethiobiotin synthetase